jgi:FG-GAP-like repeat
VLYLSDGDGSFTQVAVTSDIDFEQKLVGVVNTTKVSCDSGLTTRGTAGNVRSPRKIPVDNFGPWATDPARVAPPKPTQTVDSSCYVRNRTIGKRFYVMDVNGDGIPDIVTTIAPDYRQDTRPDPGVGAPTETDLCHRSNEYASSNFLGSCTRVFLGSASGQFTPLLPATNVADESLYSTPAGSQNTANPYWRSPSQADIDGDGLQDVLSSVSGNWRSLGDGNFLQGPVADSSQLCGVPIDFNGDGRSDCLQPSDTPSSQNIRLSYGAAFSAPLAQFAQNYYTYDSLFILLSVQDEPICGMLWFVESDWSTPWRDHAR